MDGGVLSEIWSISSPQRFVSQASTQILFLVEAISSASLLRLPGIRRILWIGTYADIFCKIPLSVHSYRVDVALWKKSRNMHHEQRIYVCSKVAKAFFVVLSYS